MSPLHLAEMGSRSRNTTEVHKGLEMELLLMEQSCLNSKMVYLSLSPNTFEVKIDTFKAKIEPYRYAKFF